MKTSTKMVQTGTFLGPVIGKKLMIASQKLCVLLTNK